MTEFSIPTNHRFIDLTDRVYGRLAVESYALSRNGKCYWLCACVCGNATTVSGDKLRGGRTKSCGCYRRDNSKKLRATHGMSKTIEYRVLDDMKTRCYNPNSISYVYYGGRGITVCDRWLNSFPAFLSDMGRKPKGMSIDRIDNDKGYSKENCKWSTSGEQTRNRRKFKSNSTGVSGVKKTASGRLAATIGVNGKSHWLGTYATIEEAAAARKAGEAKYWH